MVRFQSMSPGRGREVREARLRAPRTLWCRRSAILSSTCRATLATTARAVALERSGMTEDSWARVATRWTSGSRVSRTSGSVSRERTPRRSMASVCMTRTTRLGK